MEDGIFYGMQAGDESSEVSKSKTSRKRTDSNGASSDSDLSDGWNFVDHLDVNNQDWPSSDGESVEVIDNESLDNGSAGEPEEEGSEKPDNKMLVRPDAPVVSADQTELSSVAEQEAVPAREEMFGSFISWFLLFLVSVLLVSNFIRAAEDFLDCYRSLNTYESVPQPSFLRDLPVMPKQPQQNKIPNKILWATNEEATVEAVVDDGANYEESMEEKSPDKSYNNIETKEESFNNNNQRTSLKIFNHEVEKYFNDLSRVTGSIEAQNKFAQTLLILDALHVGLNDLEEIVTESSELHQVLKSQKHKLTEVLSEIEFGVARSMEKVATIVLNKVQKLEKSFENQWCKLERRGHKEELKGLFYDCYDERNDNSHGQKTDFDRKENGKDVPNRYEYAVDKDSTGKMYSRPSGGDYHNEIKNKKYHKNDNENYHFDTNNKFDNDKNILKHEKSKSFENPYKNEKELQHKNQPPKPNKEKKHDKPLAEKFDQNGYKMFKNEEKQRNEKPHYKHNENHNKHHPYNNDIHKKSDKHEKLKHYEKADQHENEHDKDPRNSKPHDSNKFQQEHEFEKSSEDEKSCKQKSDKQSKDYEIYQETDTSESYEKIKGNEKSKYDRNEYHHKQKQNNFIKSAAEKLGKYFKENCDKNRKITSELYQKLKESIKDKIKVPIELFNNMFNKYCAPNKGSYQEEKYMKENSEKETYGKSYKHKGFPKGNSMVIEDQNIKNVMEFRMVDSTEGNDIPLSQSGNKIIEPTNKARQWTFSYEESPSTDNKSNVDGEWFIKAGESRSKVRWSHHRGDWWFDRASQRRSTPHPTPHSWFAGRRKNWFFRRAWARQQCRQSPHEGWCHLPQDETIAVPTPASNFR